MARSWLSVPCREAWGSFWASRAAAHQRLSQQRDRRDGVGMGGQRGEARALRTRPHAHAAVVAAGDEAAAVARDAQHRRAVVVQPRHNRQRALAG
jgi:hypothetical protein